MGDERAKLLALLDEPRRLRHPAVLQIELRPVTAAQSRPPERTMSMAVFRVMR